MQASSFVDPGGGICNSPDVVLQNVAVTCKPYIDSLQTCAVNPVNEQTKFQIVNQTANCMGFVWGLDADPTLYSSYISELGSPPRLTRNESCTYPDFIPILQRTCAFDYSQMNITCTDSGPEAWNMTPYIYCAAETTLQYWRCAQQQPHDGIATCVEKSAVKADWLPQFQPYSGAKSCPNSTSYILRQVSAMLTGLVPRILHTMYGRRLWEKIKSLRRSSNSGPYYPCEQADFWRPETRYVLKASRLLQSLGKDVLTAYLTVLVLHKSHATGVFSTTGAFWQSILLYAIRPRTAPVTGLLGFFHGFSEMGLADVFADGMLSWVAGTSLLTRYWYIFFAPPSNPAAPLAALGILGYGAVLSSTPAFVFLGLVLLLSLFMGSGPLGGIFVFLGFLGIITLFMCFLPILGVIEMIARVVFKIRSRGKNTPKDAARARSRWEEWLAIQDPRFRRVYALMVMSSIVINVGNWMFFVTFLRLQGEMFCPSDLGKVMAIWILVPYLTDLSFSVFRGLTDIRVYQPWLERPIGTSWGLTAQ